MQVTDPETGICLIYVECPVTGQSGDPGDDGPSDTGSGASCFWDGKTKASRNHRPAGPLLQRGGLLVERLQLLHLPPGPGRSGRSNWQGHEPGDGAVYNCYQPQTDLLIWIWSADPPPNSSTGPTPREVAQLAIEQMSLRAIDIGITEPGDDSIGIVRMPVWLWVAAPNTPRMITESATAGGITVTATAQVRQVTWSMGDGTDVVCATAGTPYKAAYGDKSSPDCGHTYEKSSALQSDGKYAVAATSDWVITWEGAGQTGTILLNGLTRTTAISVGEAQVLVQ